MSTDIIKSMNEKSSRTEDLNTAFKSHTRPQKQERESHLPKSYTKLFRSMTCTPLKRSNELNFADVLKIKIPEQRRPQNLEP